MHANASLGMRALSRKIALQVCSTSPFSAFSLKNASTTQEWVRPPTLVDLMKVGEESLNPMVEIGLDEWMRLSVHSFTLSLKS
jgi:hypothetical protein